MDFGDISASVKTLFSFIYLHVQHLIGQLLADAIWNLLQVRVIWDESALWLFVSIFISYYTQPQMWM